MAEETVKEEDKAAAEAPAEAPAAMETETSPAANGGDVDMKPAEDEAEAFIPIGDADTEAVPKVPAALCCKSGIDNHAGPCYSHHSSLALCLSACC